jgi:hypothetical protein
MKLFTSTAMISITALSLMAGSAQAEMKSIADSWHNLGALNSKTVTPSGNAPANHSNSTAEICVFCHTPHGGDNTAAVPLWNRKLNDAANYTRYGSLGTSTFDAAEVDIGSVTIACLSCHDGGQAIDSMINAPGSGGFVVIDNYAYGSVPRLGTMEGGDLDSASGKLMLPSQGIVQNLETDLSNDHPVSMQYAGGGISSSGGAWEGTANDPDFTGSGKKDHPGQKKADNSTVTVTAMAAKANNPLARHPFNFWLDRGDDSLEPGARDREDIIFYARNYQGVEQPFVECGSCHDPHNVDNPTFLRTSNGIPSTLAVDFPLAANDAPSGLCLTCHIK